MQYLILIADDHPLFRSALHEAVQIAVEDVKILEVDSVADLQVIAENHPDADLVLLDLLMPDAQGFTSLALIRGQFPALPVVVVSGIESPMVVQRTMAYGSSGFIPKSSSLSTIAEAIRSVLEGNIWLPEGYELSDNHLDIEVCEFADRLALLTKQQFKVLGMICEGMLNKQIAYELKVSEATVKAHISALFKKLNIHSRTQVVIAMQQLEVNEYQLEEFSSLKA
jgi:DNA-binding NarL/FixJ family response regulator